MKHKTKTVITISAWQRTTIRQESKPVSGWCERCAAEVNMISADEAARSSTDPSRAISQQFTDAGMHVAETKSGALLICERSLSIASQKLLERE